MRFVVVFLLATAVFVAKSNISCGFYANGRWSATATDATVQPLGFPATLTWSIVADGTPLTTGGSSNLISFFDATFGNGGGGADLTQRPWFPMVEQSFGRWAAVSGLAFVYEPSDDGATHGSWLGSLGVRGDIRLAGKLLDGVGGTNAQAGFIPNADLTVDTGDPAYFGNTASNYRAARNTLMHEIGHSLGLGHIDSNPANFLMESVSNNTLYGPQLDDVRGVHSLYGDRFERLAGGIGNGTIATATSLGPIAPGKTVTIGAGIGNSTSVAATATDFVSISNQNDVDFFSFDIEEPSLLALTLTPVGATYNERITGTLDPFTTTNAALASNLSLELYAIVDSVPQLIAAANNAPIGMPESLLNVELPSADAYFIRISGDSNSIQLYRLDLSVESLPLELLPGDFNRNGAVEGADFLLWQRGFGVDYTAEDLAAWKSNYGAVKDLASATFVRRPIPEPASSLLIALGAGTVVTARAFRRGVLAIAPAT